MTNNYPITTQILQQIVNIAQQNPNYPYLHNLTRIAQHQSCELDTLKTLLQHPAEAVQTQAAQNPNCTANTLQHIIATTKNHRVTAAALTNPNLDEQTLDHYYHTLPANYHEYILTNPNCPDPLLTQTLNLTINETNTPELAAASNNPKIPRKNLGEYILNLLDQPDTPTTTNLLYHAITNPTFDNETLLHRLADHTDAHVRRAVAQNPNTGSDTLQKLAEDKEEQVRAETAQNPHTDRYTLQKLADSINHNIYSAIPFNPNCTPELLQHLLQTKPQQSNITWFIANSPHITPEIIQQLLSTKSTPATQIDLANSPSLTTELTYIRTLLITTGYPYDDIQMIITLAQTTDTLLNKKPDKNTPKSIYQHLKGLGQSNRKENELTPVIKNLYDKTYQYATKHNLLTTAQKLTLQKQADDGNWKTPTTTPTLSPAPNTTIKTTKPTTTITITQ